jgi:regulation of enolase protein 1 (concanavalin A-like superfamily)
MEARMQWLNEPKIWQRTGGVLQVNADPGTDFWRVTSYGYVRDNGHLYGEMAPGDVDVDAVIRGRFTGQYDQAGLMLRADERVWLKAGVEFYGGKLRLSTVLTVGYSSWTMADLPGDVTEIALRVSRRGEAVEVRYALPGREPELCALVYLPPDRELLAGVMCAAPESSGFTVAFHDLAIRQAPRLPADPPAWEPGQ